MGRWHPPAALCDHEEALNKFCFEGAELQRLLKKSFALKGTGFSPYIKALIATGL
jgi:hypothetical protein